MLKMYKARISHVYKTGLVDAISYNENKQFKEINVGFSPGNEPTLDIGDHVIVLSDGFQHYITCQINDPQNNFAGNMSILKSTNDLADLDGIKTLASVDEFGNQCRIVVSRGGGVIADSGEFCLTHWDPGRESKIEYFKRSQTISPGLSIENSLTNKCETEIKFRTTVDYDSVKRDLDGKRDDSKDKGNILTIDINKDQILNIRARDDGSINSSIQISNNGDQSFSSGTSSVEIKNDGKVCLHTSSGSITLDNDGKIFLGNAAVDLITVLKKLVGLLAQSKVNTLLGPQDLIPLNPGGAEVIKLLLESIEGNNTCTS